MKSHIKAVWILVVLVLAFWSGAAWAERFALGDLGFDPVLYRTTLKNFPPHIKMAVPSSFDWRDSGVVTKAKDQGYCGSCWAFACVGVMESKIILNGGSPYNLSEEQLVSCDSTMSGCCGGNYLALRYWYDNNPFKEVCTGYYDYSTSCSTETRVACGSLDCEAVPYNSATLFTVNTASVDDVKASIYEDGPAYFSFFVYSDFFTYWSAGSSGSVYRQASGVYEGGHAVLIIGWDDTKQAWLCKNSWGAAGGPNDDGTFWIAWSGHAHNLSFGMANIELEASVPSPPSPNELTQINLFSPSHQATISGLPTFTWAVDGGLDNAYAVDVSYSSTFKSYWSTHNNLGLSISNTSWTPSQTVWNQIPSGKWVYWRVRGVDWSHEPVTVIMSGQVRSFYKP